MASDTPSESVRLDPAAFLQSCRQTAGYRPHLLSADRYRRALDGHPWFTLREADAMRRDPQVTFSLRILRAALYQVKVNIVADDKKVGQFIHQQFQKIWRSSLRQFLGFFEYGVSVGEISYATEKRKVVFDRFDPVHPRDARPLEFAKGKHRGQFCGIRVRGHLASDCKGGEFDLLAPHAFWFSGESEYGSYWSQPRMAGAYEPWLEKRGRHGAVQSRQLWFKKGAFSGGSIRYPVGKTSYDNGDGATTIDNQDLARQIAEDVMAGAVMSLPSTMDKNGQFLWTYEPPKAGNEVRNILEYPQELDKEILIGMGIPPELVSAATVGSGYSGRAIPAQMFFSSCDEVVHLLVDAIDRQILCNLVIINFGRQSYHIIPDSLAEKVLDDNDKSKAKPKGDDKQPVQLSLTAKQRLTRRLKKLKRRLRLGWTDEDKGKHPREKTGRFAKKGSGTNSAGGRIIDRSAEQSPASEEDSAKTKETNAGQASESSEKQSDSPPQDHPALAQIKEIVSGWLSKSDLSETIINRYHKDMTAVLAAMPETRRMAAINNVGAGKAFFYPDTKTVTAACAKMSGKKEKRCAGFVVHPAGGFEGMSELHLDGGKETDPKWPDKGREVYAHELGHLLDPGHVHSKSPRWMAAYKKDIVKGRQFLSKYAFESPAEGFAEFHRHLVIHGDDDARAKFPACHQYFQHQGWL